jgi:integrase
MFEAGCGEGGMTSIDGSRDCDDGHLRTVEMLRDVLDGERYEVVANRQGISRSAVERRVKALAVRLTHAVGVEGLQESGAAFVKRLRLHREAILQALEQFDPAQVSSQRVARVLAAEEVDLGARRVRSRSTRPLHDLALYYLPFATGLRPLEVARLELGDYLLEDGSVRRESRVRADVAINGRERPLFFNHRRLDEALGAYLDERLRAGHAAGTDGRWRGLAPCSPLFLGAAGEVYPITANGGEGQHRHVCRPLLEIYRKIFRQADVPGLCTQSARLTLMARMYERGADEDQVGMVLGIADRSAVREQLPRPRPELAKVLEELA